MSLPEVNVEKFRKDGYLLVKNVLSPEEVETLRELSYKTIEEDKKKGTMIIHRFARNHIGCLSNIEGYKKLILDERTIHIAEQLLGGKPCFYGDSVMEIGIGNRGFHKDASNRDDPNHPDWTEENPIIRIAYYLEDHEKHSGGLKVRRESHNNIRTDVGEPVIVPSQAGDAVIWYLRTSHAGNAVRLRMAPNKSLHHRIEKRIPGFLKVSEEKERVSIFLSYARKGAALDRFITFMNGHEVYQKRIAQSEYPDELVREIESKLDFINIKEYQPANS